MQLILEQITEVVVDSLKETYDLCPDYVDHESEYYVNDIRQAVKVILSLYMSGQEYQAWLDTLDPK